ncbi:MAG: CPBP family intramembrane metalloprotease [Planctomycetes bacterium]|nr:CPBP family intramembrane metalloprotease [Planctomycetota bacterium]
MSRPAGGLTGVVLRAELRQLLRDRRALFAAVVLPVLLYPLLLGGTRRMEEAAEESMGGRDLELFVDLEGVGAETRAALEEALAGPHTTLTPCSAAGLLEVQDSLPSAHRARLRTHFEELTNGGRTAVVLATEPEGTEGPLMARVFARRKDPLSREASSRGRARLREWSRREGEAQRLELLAVDPAAPLAVEARNIASAEDQGGRELGQFLPILLVFLLVSGGSYGALTVFAGEREAGTLETLLTTPADRGHLVRGKFLCVLAATGAALLSNLAGLALAAAMGSADLPGGALGAGRLLSTAVFLPTVVLLTAVLCLACGRARSFRQGQQLLFPLTLCLVVPTTVVLVPDLEHSIGLGLVPLAGAALSLRDALRGALTPGPTLAMMVSHLALSAVLLRRLAVLLDAERALAGGAVRAEAAQRRLGTRAGHVVGGLAVLLMLAVGTRLQAQAPLGGLLGTLWLVLLPLALIGHLRIGRALGPATPSARLFGGCRPSALVAAALAAPPLAWAVEQLVAHLLRWLPLPSSAAAPSALVDLVEGGSTLTLVAVFALSPAVVEELLFRGTVLGALLRDGRPARAILTSAGLFALAHLSLHRLPPTFALGCVLGVVAWRTRSVWPAVVLHAAYNAWAVLSGTERLPELLADNAVLLRWVGLAALAALPFLGPRREES